MTLTAITDDVIRSLYTSKQVQDLRENEDSWRLGTFGLLKRQASWNNGW